MTTPARPLATCILRWIYEQVAAVLEALKVFLLTLIAQIDTIIAFLRAWLAQWDFLARAEQFVYDLVQQAIDDIREQLTSIPGGPLQELCPEFYAYFLDPALAMFDRTVASLNIFRERYKNMLSFMDEVDRLILYWEQIKVDLLYAIDIIDDGIYQALARAASEVP